MIQQFFLIFFLSLCASIKANIQLAGQAMPCTGSALMPGRVPLLNFTNLLIVRGGKEVGGSITILLNITSLKVSIDYTIEKNGAETGSFSDDVGNVCDPLKNLSDNSPASNIFDRIFQQNLPNVGCLPLQAKKYDMNGVEINQATLKYLDQSAIYVIQIKLDSGTAYSCIKLRGRGAPNTN